MYEEEDDDLPMQYRRLTAHLQTGSADFNRRLSAYLTNHVAMRSALDQAITNSYAQQYPNAPQFAHNQNMYPSPFMTPNMTPTLPQQQSPSTFGQPYPSPGTPGYRPGHQARSASGTSHGTPSYSPNMPAPSPVQAVPHMDHRRTSASSKSSSHSPTGAPATPQSMHARPTPPQTSSSFTVKQEGPTSQQMRVPPQQSAVQQQHQLGGMNGFSSMSPFTTSLPTEAQMLLGSALDPNDPFTSMLMAGSENLPQPYNHNTNSSTLQKPRSFNQSYDGMSATLAPSALDMSPSHQIYALPSTTISASPASSPAFQLPYDGSYHDFSKSQMYAGGNSASGSGTVTPAGIDGGWDAFINDTSWAETTN